MEKLQKNILIAALINHMWDVEWFNNFNTHGCYGVEDFRSDLVSLDVDQLVALRRYQDENLADDLFYEYVWTGEEIVYTDLTGMPVE